MASLSEYEGGYTRGSTDPDLIPKHYPWSTEHPEAAYEGIQQAQDMVVDLRVQEALRDATNDDLIEQFVADGGAPWDVFRIESAFLGSPLEV